MTAAHRAYRLLARLLCLPLLSWLWWRGRREPGYRQHLEHRLGFIPIQPERMGCIWIHAASVGEVQALQPLLQDLLLEWPSETLVVSTQSPSGAQALRNHWGDRIQHLYAPLDTPGAVSRFLDRLQPRLLVLMERELWPEWLHQCAARAVPVVLVNARLSAHSARAYQRWSALMHPVWQQITVAAADADSAQRLQTLGVPADRVRETGNLKFDVPPPGGTLEHPPELNGRTLVVAGSTHEGDEDAWLTTWAELSPQNPDWLLVLVPRHPQRFDAVAARLQRSGLTHVRRSSLQTVPPTTQVLLVDAMGELVHWYRQATLCFVGGTLAPIGGHNPLEPLSVGQPVLFGPHTHNAASLFDEVVQAGAGERVRNTAELTSAVQRWMTQTDKRRLAGDAAQSLIVRNRGSARRTLLIARPHWYPARTSNIAAVKASTEGEQQFWFDPRHVSAVSAATFEPHTYTAGQALATGSGRGQALLIQQGEQRHVLRHYRRGGLMARLSHDRFWRTPPQQSRAMREFALLRLMRSWELPVPEPVAARFTPDGLLYRADIIVVLIPASQNVVELLQQRTLSDQQWMALGQAIRQLHDRQVFHADLNAHNLLVDHDGKAWVVDFDKCDVRPGIAWKSLNLQRLLRSLRKEAGRVTPFHWSEPDWEHLMAGYQQAC